MISSMELKEFLKNNVLVAANVGDMDSCGSFVAFRELARKLCPKTRLEFTFSGALNKEGEKILKLFNFQTKLIEDVPLEDFENLVLIDTQLNNVPEYLRKKKTIIIDHHQKAAEIPAGSAFDSEAASTTEIIYGLFKKYKIKPSETAAKAIVYGMIADTAGMRYAKTKTFSLMSEILENHKLDYQKLLAEIYEERDISERIAWLKTARRLEFRNLKNKLIVTSGVAAFESSAASKLMGLGADVVLVTSQKPGEVRIVGRARHGINLAEIFTKVANELKGTGGGHPGACVMNLQEGKDKAAINLVIKELERIL